MKRLNRHHRGAQGFTLIELLIAMAILAMIGVAAALALNSALSNEDQLRQRAQQLDALSYAMAIMRQDLEQAVSQPDNGNPYQLSQRRLLGHPGPDGSDGIFLQLVRTGQPQIPGAEPRSRLQRVIYRWQDEQLIRVALPVPDPLDDRLPQGRVMLQGVSAVTLQYLDQQWLNQWSDQQAALPRAVRLRLTTDNWGAVEQLMLLPAGL